MPKDIKVNDGWVGCEQSFVPCPLSLGQMTNDQ